MGRPPFTIEIAQKDQKELAKILGGGVQQVRVVLRALSLVQLAKGTGATGDSDDVDQSFRSDAGQSGAKRRRALQCETVIDIRQ